MFAEHWPSFLQRVAPVLAAAEIPADTHYLSSSAHAHSMAGRTGAVPELAPLDCEALTEATLEPVSGTTSTWAKSAPSCFLGRKPSFLL